MNINSTSSAQTQAPPSKPAGSCTRTREQGDAEQDATNGAGFLAMLHALTEPEAEPSQPSAPPTAESEQLVQDDTAAQDAAAVLTMQTAPAAPLSPDAATTQRLADGALAPAGNPQGQRSMQRHGVSQHAPGTSNLQTAPDGSAAGNLAGGKSHMPSTDNSDMAQQMALAAAEASDTAGAQSHKGTVAKEPDISLLRPLVSSQAGASVVSMFEAGLAGLRAGPGARSVERGLERHVAAHAAPGFIAWSDSAPTGTSHQSASAVYAPTASTPVPAAALAQKMHYWVAGGVQSAELKLDAFGGGSVDVRISVKGDEAMVTFRSDQPQARQLLLDAMPQLKELLAGEGLLLSGGFVGGSTQQSGSGHGGNSDRPSVGVRTGSVRDTRASAPSIAAVRGASGGAVDLFV